MIQARFFIEAQGNHKDAVKNSLIKLLEKLKLEEGVTVKSETIGEAIYEDDVFSSILEADLRFDGFLSFVKASLFYTPTAVEMMEPSVLLLSRTEFLEGLAEVISTVKTVFSKLKVKIKFNGGKKRKIGLSREEIEERMDEGAIRAKIVVEKEGKSMDDALAKVQKTLGEHVLINAMKGRKVKSETPFVGVVGVDALVTSPVEFFDIALKHVPVLVEIKEPEDVKLTMLDLQDICLNISGTFFELSCMVVQPEEEK